MFMALKAFLDLRTGMGGLLFFFPPCICRSLEKRDVFFTVYFLFQFPGLPTVRLDQEIIFCFVFLLRREGYAGNLFV